MERRREPLAHPFMYYFHSLAVIFGIAAGLSGSLFASASVMTAAALTAFLARRKFEAYRPLHAAIAVLLAAGSIGYGSITERLNQTSLPPDSADQEAAVIGVIVSPVKVDGDRVSFQLRADSVKVGTFSGAAHERFQTTIYLDSEEEQQEARTWRRGTGLRLAGVIAQPGTARNFGDFDYRAYLLNQRIHWQLTVEGLQGTEKKEARRFHADGLLGAVDQLRAGLSRLISTLYEERYAGFMQGLLIGDRNELPHELYDMFSDIGMTHVLAISGLHVGVFTAGCFWLLRCLRLTKEKAVNLCLILIPLYVLCTGASPSALRAGLMAVLGLVAVKRNRLKDSARFIVLAAVAMLIWNPYYLYNVSFQLSFVVTLGLILVAPRLTAWLPIRSRLISGSLAVTITAQLFSFPLVIHYFHIVHALSPPANMLLVPLVSIVLLPLGMISLLLGLLHPVIGYWPAAIVSWAAEGLFRAVEFTASLDFLIISWSQVPLWWIVLYYGLLGLLFLVYPAVRPVWTSGCARGLLVMTCGSLLAVTVYAHAGDHWNRNGIVSVLDVGQGDAIFIRTPQGKNLLVDGGGTIRFTKANEEWRMRADPYEVGKDLLVPLLRRRGIHRLDAVIATHHDADHIGGLHAVVERIPTERILFNGTLRDSAYLDRLIRAALDKDIPLVPVASGLEWQVDEETTITFLHPFQQSSSSAGLRADNKQNEASVVFVVQMFGSSFLLTGDIGSSTEKAIIGSLVGNGGTTVEEHETAPAPSAPSKVSRAPSSTPLAIDVLKIAHHGSKHSTSREWLEYWRPASGVISVGRNNYGHPSPDVLDRLSELRIDPFRTDLHGEVQYRITDHRLQVRTKMDVNIW